MKIVVPTMILTVEREVREHDARVAAGKACVEPFQIGGRNSWTAITVIVSLGRPHDQIPSGLFQSCAADGATKCNAHLIEIEMNRIVVSHDVCTRYPRIGKDGADLGGQTTIHLRSFIVYSIAEVDQKI